MEYLFNNILKFNWDFTKPSTYLKIFIFFFIASFIFQFIKTFF